MRVWVICGCIYFLLSCGSEPREVALTKQTTDTVASPSGTSTVNDTDLSFAKTDVLEEEPPVVQKIKHPSGVYRFLMPYNNEEKILQTISFAPGTFRMQEEFGSKRDSVVVTEGTWAPSAGYIWLYKGQIVRGRYTWKGDTLQYYSPQLKKVFSMEKLAPAVMNAPWQKKRQEGAVFYAVGTEPFWSVEITGRDTVVLNMPDWNAPLTAKLKGTSPTADSTVYTTGRDSLQVTVYPLFCSDGMSDFLYTQRVKLVYKGQTYNGCGERLQ